MNSVERQQVWQGKINEHTENCPNCWLENDCDEWEDLIVAYNSAREIPQDS
jgi:RNA polymerase subunit RPABC4/transcription elongation factor Spt4